jgi:hypothetical protein
MGSRIIDVPVSGRCNTCRNLSKLEGKSVCCHPDMKQAERVRINDQGDSVELTVQLRIKDELTFGCSNWGAISLSRK